MLRATVLRVWGAHGGLLGSDVALGHGVLDSGPGLLDSSLEHLSGCDLFRTPAEGGGEPQSSCSRTHTHPLGCFYLDATTVLRPSLHVARSHPPAPRLPHIHHCSQLVRPGATLTPLPLCPGPQAGFSQVAATHHCPCNESYSPLPSSALALKIAHPALGLTFKWLH